MARSGADRSVVAADPFELPEWLGTGEVTWATEQTVAGSAAVTGRFEQAGVHLAADLMAVDRAFPVVALADDWRTPAHQAWAHGEVLLLEVDERLTLAVPGHALTADLALEALRRFARSIGIRSDRLVAALRL